MPARTLVLTAPPGSGALGGDAVEAGQRAIPIRDRGQARWLAPGEAWEMPFHADDGEAKAAADVRAHVEASLSGLPVDVNVVCGESATRRKRLLVADMESTIICEELIDELAGRAGLRHEISAITARAMRGELGFEASLRERVAMLAGLEAALLNGVYEDVTVMGGTETLIGAMKRSGACCALVSGGFSVFAGRIAKRLGFDEYQANVLEIEGGKLTGRVKEPILGRSAKRAALERMALDHGLDLSRTVAVGDGANDLDMLGAAGLGVAFRAKPKVQEAARNLPNGAVITHADLTGVLYLQGYLRSEFAV